MIQFEHVTKKYGATLALSDVSFHIMEGETVGLLGRNGAGKTTALNLAAGYFPPTEGVVRIGGRLMAAEGRACRRRIGYLPEKPPLYGEMTVRDYLSFVCDLREVKPAGKAAHIAEILDLCGLADVPSRVLGHLSRGMRQRVGIAQALCGNPDILILDEPTVGLDPSQTAEMRQLIRALSQDHTVIFSSHILTEVQQLCPRVLLLDEGCLIRDMRIGAEAEASPSSILLRVEGPASQLIPSLQNLPCVQQVKLIRESDGETELSLNCIPPATDQIFYLLASLNAPIRMMRPEQENLEELFLSAVGQERT